MTKISIIKTALIITGMYPVDLITSKVKRKLLTFWSTALLTITLYGISENLWTIYTGTSSGVLARQRGGLVINVALITNQIVIQLNLLFLRSLVLRNSFSNKLSKVVEN